MRFPRRNILVGLAITLASLMGLVLLPSPVTAQTFYGSLTGTVTDPTGGVLPGASVTVTNTGTNSKNHAVTDASGNFRFVNLVPAVYQVDAEMAGFKHATRGNVRVAVQATVRVDIALEVGEISETVEVSAEAKLLQTESGELSSVVSGDQVQEMPLNGRNVMNLIALAPGVVPQGSSEGPTTMNQGTHTNNAGWGNFQIGGGIAGQSAWFIDGGTLNVLNSNTIALVPAQDSIQEFRVSSNAVSSEYGRFGGGVVNMTTKSGTNSFHGSAYGYLRNKSLNANDFFSELQGKDKQEWSQYQYGGTIAGPIIKNKLFFFGGYEHFQSRLSIPTTAIIPTEAMRAGTFNRPITDPTGRGCVTQPAANTWQINPSCFDPSSLIMRDVYYPPPNTTGQGYNWFSVPTVGNDGDQYNARLDYNVSENHRIFARYTFWNAQDIPFNTYGNILTSNAASQNKAQQAVIGDTLTLNPTTVLDFRVSYLREYYDDLQPSEGLDLSMFGPAWGALNGQVTFQTTPNYQFAGANNLQGSKGQLTSIRYFNVYGFATSLTKILSSHTVKIGGEIRLADANMTGTSTVHTGQLRYDTSLVGDEYAAFLMGLPTSLTIGKLYPSSTYNWYQGYYVTDTWTATKKLTVNLGLRWELPGTTAERKDKATVLLPDTLDPVTGKVGTLALVSSDLYPDRYMMKKRYNLFAPRVSFAYQLDPKTVLRAGYGLNFLPPDMTMEGGMFALSSPINAAQNVWFNRKDPATGLMVPGYRVTSNPFPQGPPEPPLRNNPNFMQTLIGQNLVGFNPEQDHPYTQQWNVSLGHEFPGDLLVEVAYAGSKGTNLPLPGGNNNINMNLNQLESQYWSLGSALMATSPIGSHEDGRSDLEAVPLLPEHGPPRRLRRKVELQGRDGQGGKALPLGRRDLGQLHVVEGRGQRGHRQGIPGVQHGRSNPGLQQPGRRVRALLVRRAAPLRRQLHSRAAVRPGKEIRERRERVREAADLRLERQRHLYLPERLPPEPVHRRHQPRDLLRPRANPTEHRGRL